MGWIGFSGMEPRLPLHSSKWCFVSLLGALLLLGATPEAQAYSITTGFTEGCHEGITIVAYYLAAAPEFPFEDVPVPEGVWEDVAGAIQSPLGLPQLDRQEYFFFHSLLAGVRSPDTEGGSALNIGAIRNIHLSENGQYAHCLRNIDDDGAEGEATAVSGCAQAIRDALDDARAYLALPTAQQVILVNFSTDFYGTFEVHAWAPAYHIGRALHALQDAFTHTLRTEDFRSIIHVMNYAEAVGGDLEESRDGMAHSESMDACEGVTEPVVEATIEAAADLLRAFSSEINAGDEESGEGPVDAIIVKWVTYTPGCTVENDYCNSPWVSVAREKPTGPLLETVFGCSMSSARKSNQGAWWCLLVLSALVVLRRRRTA